MFCRKIAGTVVGLCCNVACLLSLLIGPYMPKSALELRKQLGLGKNKKLTYGYIPTVFSLLLPAGHLIQDPKPLFKKIEDSTMEALRKKFAGKQGSPDVVKKEMDKLTIKDKKAPEENGVQHDVATLEAMIAKQVNYKQQFLFTGFEWFILYDIY